MRSNLTLIKLVKKEFGKGDWRDFCRAINDLYLLNKITYSEYERIWGMLHLHEPEEFYRGTGYWFKPGDKAPRLKILNKIIKELERQ